MTTNGLDITTRFTALDQCHSEATSASMSASGDIDGADGEEAGVRDDVRNGTRDVPSSSRARGGCPTCSGPRRETVSMVCQTCGTDYAAEPAPHMHEWVETTAYADSQRRLQCSRTGCHAERLESRTATP